MTIRPLIPAAIAASFSGNNGASSATSSILHYGARLCSPALCRWISPDPLAEKYYSTSPYAFCANNPVNIIDPDGEDIFKISRSGILVDRITDKSQDVFQIVEKVNGEWKDIDGQLSTYEYGTITAVRTPSVDLDGEMVTSTIFEVNGNSNAKRLFLFLQILR